MMGYWWNKKAVLPFKTPTTIVVVGPSQSGKSTFIHRILIEADGMFEENTDRILFCYQEWQPTYDIMEKSVPHLTLNKGMPSREFLETFTRCLSACKASIWVSNSYFGCKRIRPDTLNIESHFSASLCHKAFIRVSNSYFR